jgi:hypothetical protein
MCRVRKQPAAAELPNLVPGAPAKSKNPLAVAEAGIKAVPGALKNAKKKTQPPASAKNCRNRSRYLLKNPQKAAEATD